MLEIAGPTLTLRLPSEDDVAELFAIGSDAETTRWFSWGPYRDDDEPRAWIKRTAQERAAGEKLSLIVDRDGEAIGVIELTEPNRRDRRAMVGTWLGAAHWGTGVNTESKALLLHLAFAVLGLQRVGALANVDNTRSQRALEKLGFAREGVLRRWHRHGDEYHDVVVYGLLRDDWTVDVAVEIRGEVPLSFMDFTTPS
jgi:[ribosomal protein S5]-alanine N-acetyltransferase